jgi:hypothetical protein
VVAELRMFETQFVHLIETQMLHHHDNNTYVLNSVKSLGEV